MSKKKMAQTLTDKDGYIAALRAAFKVERILNADKTEAMGKKIRKLEAENIRLRVALERGWR